MAGASAFVVARNVRVSFGPTVVLDGVDLTVAPGSRIGVVAPNGTGKTTLLRVLAGLHLPDSGTVTLAPPDATVGYLPQEPERQAHETVRAFLARRSGVTAASQELEAATAALAGGGPPAGDRYATALDRWMALGGADLDARTGPVWGDLGLDPALLDREMPQLSGGQAARVSLAGVLLSRFDVLLLDEPTNDLDFDGLERLERFVTGVDRGVVIVSHDRAFLERTVTSVLEIDEHSRQASLFAGGWLAYLVERATARRHGEEAYAVYHDARARLEERARTQRQWAEVGVRSAKRKATDNDKIIRKRRAETSERQAAKARATERALERLAVVDKPWEGWELRLEIASAARSGAVVARLDRATVQRGEFRLGPVDLEIRWADRVAIVGANGAGKTTLLGALLGEIPLAGGESYLGPAVVAGGIDQARARLELDLPLLDAFQRGGGPPTASEARSVLAKFGLGEEHVGRPASQLSPGERTRAVLAWLMARGVNCLVLDEPTNHLDLEAIVQLEQALDTFGGTLLLVTHDRRLLDEVRVTRTLTVRGGLVTAR